MRNRILIVSTLLLTAVVLQTAVRIEVLNVRAGNYLPRSDRNADGTFADGKWRISPDNTPRDQLRALVQTYGLLQYLFAPLLVILSIVGFRYSKGSLLKVIATLAMAVAVIAILLAFYRGYYSSSGL